MLGINNIINEIDLVELYRTLHSNTEMLLEHSSRLTTYLDTSQVSIDIRKIE